MKPLLIALALLAVSATAAHADIVQNIVCENNDFIQIITDQDHLLQTITINDAPTMIAPVTHKVSGGHAHTILNSFATGQKPRSYTLDLGSEPMVLSSGGQPITTCISQ